MDGRYQGAVPLRLVAVGGDKRFGELLPPPTPAGAPPLELKYAHLLADFNFATYRTGALNNIVDYVRLPKHQRQLGLEGYALALTVRRGDGRSDPA